MSNTEAKLKQLKVVDLKDLLQKASVAIPPKVTKADLITKILANSAAVDLFNKQNPTNGATSSKPSAPPPVYNDLLSPPEQFDWESTTIVTTAPIQTPTATVTATAPLEKPVIPIKPSTPAVINAATVTTSASIVQSQASKASTVNDEIEKRKKRAERFGVPLLETKQKPTPASQNPSRASAEDVNKLQARAARFGVPVTNSGQKRGRSPAPADKEEEEKRKKRAERFNATITKT